MNERELTIRAVTGALIVFAVLLLLVGGCQAISGDDDGDGCGRFALAAVAKPASPAPRRAAPAPRASAPPRKASEPVRKAPSLDKKPPREQAPARPGAVASVAPDAPAVQQPSTPTPTATAEKKKSGHRGVDIDVCD